jgi:hypothetical protein
LKAALMLKFGLHLDNTSDRNWTRYSLLFRVFSRLFTF